MIKKSNIYFFIISLFFLFLLIFIYDIYLTENFFNYNFHYKSNVLDYYAIDNRLQLLQSMFDYNFFFDLSLALLLSNYIFINIPKIIKDYKTAYHLQIIWIIKIFFIFTVISIYERSTVLDQNVYFLASINNFEFLDFLDFKNKFIGNHSANTIFVYFFKILNLFFLDSWFSIKIIVTTFYLITIFYSFKIIKLFTKTHNVLFLYIMSLMPSLIYTSSIVNKDMIILPCLLIFFYYSFITIINDNKNDKKKFIMIIFLTIGIISLFRYWIAAACLFCITVYAFYLLIYSIKNWIKQSQHKIFYFTILLLILFFIFLSISEEMIKLQSYLQHLISDSYRNYQSNNFHSNGINLFNDIKNYNEFFLKLPILFFYSIFSPFVEKLGELKYTILILENILIITFVFLSFFKIKKLRNIDSLLILILSFIFIFMITHMFTGYANIGTGYRYSTQAKVPLVIVLIILNKEKIEYLLSFFFKKTKKNRIK
jgi:hypothetical protein